MFEVFDNGKNAEEHPLKTEFVLGLILIFLLGYFGIQKLIYTVNNPDSAVNVYALNEKACTGGFKLPFLSCQPDKVADSFIQRQVDKPLTESVEGPITGLIQTEGSPPLREQFARLPDLKSALQKLRWNGGSEEDAARLLSIVVTLENGRQRESYSYGFMPSELTALLDPLWSKYPDLVAASHCIYCGSFFNHVLKSYLVAGNPDSEFMNTLAVGHPRFLQAIHESGQLEVEDRTQIASLQAELLSSGDANTAQFIGEILYKDSNLELLHHWSSKGWNGGYAISNFQNLDKLPFQLVIDAWQSSISRGEDNAVLTRFLVSNGHRPALRWLLWSHASNLSYFTNRQHQMEKDRYNDFIVNRYLRFPKEAYSDLTGYYSKNWNEISWDKTARQWVVN